MITNHRRPITRAVLAGAVCLLAGGAFGMPSAGAAAGYAVVRGAHFSPDTPSVDVYLTSFSGGSTKLFLSSVGYGDVSNYARLKTGVYAVSMRKAGASAHSPAALSWTLHAHAGQAFTAAAIGMNKQLHGIVLHDDLSSPTQGEGRVRVIQASSRAPHATIKAVGGPTLADSVPFGGHTSYVDVHAGSWAVEASADNDPSVSVRSTVPVRSGTVNTIVLLDAKGSGIALRHIVDSAGSGVTPAGSVPAGGGGTAPRPAEGPAMSSTQLAGAAGLGGALLLGCALIVVRRRSTSDA
jgi:hypothetical protein